MDGGLEARWAYFASSILLPVLPVGFLRTTGVVVHLIKVNTKMSFRFKVVRSSWDSSEEGMDGATHTIFFSTHLGHDPGARAG